MGGKPAVNDWDDLPPYLAQDGVKAAGTRTYGTLSYNRRRNCWVVKAETERNGTL